MTENQLKQLYTAEIGSSAPDKDALWASIESRLTPKAAPENAQAEPTSARAENSSPRKTPLYMEVLKYAAACAVLLIAVPIALNAIPDSSLSEGASTSAADDSADHLSNSLSSSAPNAEQDAAQEEATPNHEPNYTQPLKYSDLKFDSYSETVLTCTGTPFGDSFFVEDDVLAQSDIIIIGEVSKVSLSDDGSTLEYQLTDVTGHSESTIIVESRSPYTLRRGRRYLLPLAKNDGGWRTANDSVPQTEFTADGGIVYYNGWKSLDSGSSENIIYPQASVDDHFYDRMMFSYSGDISGLIDKWRSARNI